MSTTTTTRTVWADQVDKIVKRFTKLAAKAASFGVETPDIIVTNTRTEEVKVYTEGVFTGHRYGVEVADVTVTMPAAIVVPGGWTLVAAIDVDPGCENIVRALGDTEVPAELWTAPATRCDHCHTARARKTLVALRDETGELRVIGRSCSADYIGLDLTALLNWHSASTNIETGPGGEVDFDEAEAHGDRYLVTLADVVAASAELVARVGYSKTDAEYPTKHEVPEVMQLLCRGQIGELTEKYGEATGTLVNVGDAIAWAAGLDGETDFARNLRNVAARDYTRPANIGVACYIAEGYRRHLASLAERAAAADSDAGHWGAVKARAVLTATVTDVRVFDSAYGSYAWVKATSADGHRIEWKCSGARPGIGATVTGKATVKCHGEYNGVAVTTVARWAWAPVG